MKILLSLSVISLLFVACSSENKSEEYTYDLTLNNCPTGKHSFSSQKAKCEGLVDDSLNNNCAHSMRCEMFVSECQQFDIDTSCQLPEN